MKLCDGQKGRWWENWVWKTGGKMGGKWGENEGVAVSTHADSLASSAPSLAKVNGNCNVNTAAHEAQMK